MHFGGVGITGEDQVTRGQECKPSLRQIGNPSGRPKSKILSQAYKLKLEDDVPNDPKGRTFAELLAEAMVFKAAKGDVHAASEIADRTEGKPQRAEQDNQQALTGVTINLVDITQERAQELLAKIRLLKAKNASHD